jgi:hypothetical protein
LGKARQLGSLFTSIDPHLNHGDFSGCGSLADVRLRKPRIHRRRDQDVDLPRPYMDFKSYRYKLGAKFPYLLDQVVLSM